APMPNNEHQDLVAMFNHIFFLTINRAQGDRTHPGANVSDRDAGWLQNYREPDVVVYLAENPARDAGSHWVGGPDLGIEIASPGEDPTAKLAFYAQVNTRELMIVERNPWAVELYRLTNGALVSVGRSDLTSPAVLTSGVLPLSFQLRAGTPRPTILVTHTATGQAWDV
ncbi:MAG TPA: Uma2 family endonuclease, partial [Gemmataceae bacterium]|nr:Uma2 family endonuclease [Gemmataceae bacterium]